MYDFKMIFADPKSFSREHTISLFSVFYFNLWIDYTQTHINRKCKPTYQYVTQNRILLEGGRWKLGILRPQAKSQGLWGMNSMPKLTGMWKCPDIRKARFQLWVK